MNSYRKHYFNHLKKKIDKKNKKTIVFKKIFKYYLILICLISTFPLLYTGTYNNESIFSQWFKNGFDQNFIQPENFKNLQYSFPEIQVINEAILTTNKFNTYNSELTYNFKKINKENNSLSITFPQKTNINYSLQNSDFENYFVSLKDIGDLVDINNQTLELKKPDPYKFINIKENVFRHHQHKIISGESLWSIARKYKVSLDSIITLNQIRTPHLLNQGMVLNVPQYSGVYYKIKKNDSLFSIANRYRTSISQIKEYNEIDGFLNPGDIIFLHQANLTKIEKNYLFGNIFISPVSGIITSKYGVRFHPIKKKKIIHTGIDIGDSFLEKIKSSSSGVVIKATYNSSYGKYITIKHSFGYETTYAHLKEIWVKKDQKVKKGQYIGIVGNTGFSTGPHLHYEIKHKGKYVNPLRFLKY